MQVFIASSKDLHFFSLSSTCTAALVAPTCAPITSGLQTVKTYASESLIQAESLTKVVLSYRDLINVIKHIHTIKYKGSKHIKNPRKLLFHYVIGESKAHPQTTRTWCQINTLIHDIMH